MSQDAQHTQAARNDAFKTKSIGQIRKEGEGGIPTENFVLSSLHSPGTAGRMNQDAKHINGVGLCKSLHAF